MCLPTWLPIQCILLWLTPSDDELTDALKDLTNYEVGEFCLAAIQDLIAVILKYHAVINATPADFWSRVEGAENYNKILSKKKEVNPEKCGKWTWQGDCIKQACCVWI